MSAAQLLLRGSRGALGRSRDAALRTAAPRRSRPEPAADRVGASVEFGGRTGTARGLVAVLALLLVLVNAGCGDQVSTGSSTASSASPDAAQQTLDLLAAAALRHDRDAFEQQISTTDPGFARSSSELYENLAALPLSSLAFTVSGPVHQVGAGRRSVLPRGWVQAVTARWALASDLAPATHELWWTFEVDGGHTRLAGMTDLPRPLGALPIWMLEPVQVSSVGPVTVIEPRDTTSTWAETGAQAVRDVVARVPAALREHWSGSVVLEVPNSERHFEQLLGVAAGSRSGIAAIALPEGPDPADAPVRVVINPAAVAALPADAVRLVLTHETTHVVTHSADSPVPMWLAEGYADWVAYDAAPPALAEAAEVPLIERIKSSGIPAELPGDDAFRADNADLSLAYAQAWFVCRYIADSYSPADLGELYLGMDQGQSLAGALEDALRMTAATFAEEWHAQLRQLAAGR